MSSINEKLKHFNEVILSDAAMERDRILYSIHSETDKRLESEKSKLQEQADIHLKKEISAAEAEKNNTISKAVMESKQLLMKTREEIISKIYDEVSGMLVKFTDSGDYLDYLRQQILESCANAGEGELVIYLGRRDMDRFSQIPGALIKDLPQGFSFEVLDEDIIGGCKVFNRTNSLMIDNTLMQKLELNRDSFFEVCDLRID